MARCYGHDYRSRCIYHITMKKAPGAPAFGCLGGAFPDSFIVRSRLGLIVEEEIRRIALLNGALRVLQYCIMPDHVHLLLFVTAPVDNHLGSYIGRMKVLARQRYREETGCDSPLFEDDFYDCILYRSRSLDVIYRYIRQNPYRLAVRRERPEFFRRVNKLDIAGRTYQGYGNFQLLDCPFKEQVVVHRAYTPEVRRRHRQQWLYTASNGGVLVSPFISADERAIRAEAEGVGGRFILITNEPFGERYRPGAHDFTLCEEGRLLILSAGLPGPLTRRACLALNAVAADLCGQGVAGGVAGAGDGKPDGAGDGKPSAQ